MFNLIHFDTTSKSRCPNAASLGLLRSQSTNICFEETSVSLLLYAGYFVAKNSFGHYFRYNRKRLVEKSQGGARAAKIFC